MTCRFCKAEIGNGSIKYGPRHYAHLRCLLLARAGLNGGPSGDRARRLAALERELNAIQKWQLDQVPVITTFDADERQATVMSGLGMTGREFVDYMARRPA